jgi:hypothetical protein
LSFAVTHKIDDVMIAFIDREIRVINIFNDFHKLAIYQAKMSDKFHGDFNLYRKILRKMKQLKGGFGDE